MAIGSGAANAQAPAISLTAGNPIATSATTGTLDYKITLTPEEEVLRYTIYVVTNGDKYVSEILSTTEAEGTIDLKDLNSGKTTDLWVKAKAELKNGSVTEEAQYPGEAQGWYGLTISNVEFGDGIIMPSITLEAGNAVATSLTEGTLDYKFTFSETKNIQKIEAWVVTNAFPGGDVEVARITSFKSDEGGLKTEGQFVLESLKPKAVNELWVKAYVYLTNGDRSEELIYPGAPQGWNGLSINTAAIGMKTPTIKLTAGNPTPLTPTTGTVGYLLEVENGESVIGYNIWVVTFGEKVLGRIDGTTELNGEIMLEDLNPGAETELWVKAQAILPGDALTDIVQYPGEAQGYTGLSITTIKSGIQSIVTGNDGPVEYFNLQGIRVDNPSNGIFIRRQGDKSTLVGIK